MKVISFKYELWDIRIGCGHAEWFISIMIFSSKGLSMPQCVIPLHFLKQCCLFVNLFWFDFYLAIHVYIDPTDINRTYKDKYIKKWRKWYISWILKTYMDEIYRISLNLHALHLQLGPSHCLIIVLKLFKLSADIDSLGKPFHIWDPMTLKLLEPKVIWFLKLFGFCNEWFEVLNLKKCWIQLF